MSFTLQVEFSGLCFYIIDPNGTQVGIVMPDAHNRPNLTHLDGTPAKPHVGYIRYDLANAGVDVPHDVSLDAPLYEGIHRFKREDLDFGLPSDEPLATPALELPEVKEYAKGLELLPGLYGKNPPPILLMRTVLRGGRLETMPEIESWKFSSVLNPTRPTQYEGKFAGSATWTRQVNANELVIRLGEFDGTPKSTLRLKPVAADTVVKLKVANLCSDNPLEWPEMPTRTFLGGFDDDFKWFYRLLKHTAGTPIGDLLGGEPLPAPELDTMKPVTMGGGPDCIGNQHVSALS